MLSLTPWKRNAAATEGTWMLPLEPVRSEVSQILNRFMDSPGLFDDPIRIDVRETAEEVVVRAEVPGIDPKELDIQLVGDVLTLSGEKKDEREDNEHGYAYSERRYGSFRRTLRLATPVDAEKVNAEHKNGVLTITLTKAESSRPRRIPVKQA
jgi:HSP20 family molecular chaperone IbpA